MSFVTIRTALKSKFDAIKLSSGLIQVVYDYNETNISGFPAVLIESASMKSEFGSSADNLRSYVFSVTIHQEIENAGREVASKRVDTLADIIIDALDTDSTLGGTVLLITPVGAEKTFLEDSESGKKIVMQILFEAQEFSPVLQVC